MHPPCAFLAPATSFSHCPRPLALSPITVLQGSAPHCSPPRRASLPSRSTPSCTATPSSSSSPSSNTSVSSLEQYFPSSSSAEAVFSSYVHPVPVGAGELARSRGVPVDAVSACYGHILAATAVEDIPSIARNHSVLASSLRTQLSQSAGERKPHQNVDLSTLSALISRACDPTQVDSFSSADATRMSQLYTQMLASSVHVSGLEFDCEHLCNAFADRLDDATVQFPMGSREEYEEGFQAMQKAVASVRGSSSLDAADAFFKNMQGGQVKIRDVDGDGYILAIDHGAISETGDSLGDKGSGGMAARARLFDGRCIMSVTPEEEEKGSEKEKELLLFNVKELPRVLAKAVAPLRAGEKTTVFFHPYAAHEVLPLFITAEQTPPQAGLVLDVCLVKFMDSE